MPGRNIYLSIVGGSFAGLGACQMVKMFGLFNAVAVLGACVTLLFWY